MLIQGQRFCVVVCKQQIDNFAVVRMREGKIFSRAMVIFQKALWMIFLIILFSRNQASFRNHGYTKERPNQHNSIQPALQEPDKTQQSKWRPSEKFFEMERKEPDGHDNFFASLNQLILSLEPAIKEAGSVAAAEDILTHLEATDENFHK